MWRSVVCAGFFLWGFLWDLVAGDLEGGDFLSLEVADLGDDLGDLGALEVDVFLAPAVDGFFFGGMRERQGSGKSKREKRR